jgi:DNA-binding protein HU-beta
MPVTQTNRTSIVNKADLIDAVAARTNDRRAAAETVDAVFDTITRAVAAGDKVVISGFGAFEKVERPARTGRNPRTGESVRIKKSSAPKFRAGTTLKKVVNGEIRLPKVATASAEKASAPAAKKTAAKKAPAAKKAAAKKAPAKVTPLRKPTLKKAAPAPARKAAAKKAPARKAAAKKAPARKAPARKAAAKKA